MTKEEWWSQLLELYSAYFELDKFMGVITKKEDFLPAQWGVVKEGIDNICDNKSEYRVGFALTDKVANPGSEARGLSSELCRHIETKVVRHFDNYLFMRGVPWRSTRVQYVSMNVQSRVLYNWSTAQVEQELMGDATFLAIIFVPISIFDLAGLNPGFEKYSL